MLNSIEDLSRLKIPSNCTRQEMCILLISYASFKKNYILVILLLVRISQPWERIIVNTERKAGVTHVGGRSALNFHE